MGSAYRGSRCEVVCSRRTRWGTGERFTLRVEMPEAEVLAAFQRLAQPARPTDEQIKTRGYLPFCGQVKAPRFRLEPLRARGNFLGVQVELEPRAEGTLVHADIALAIGCVVSGGALLLALTCVSLWVAKGATEFVFPVAIFATFTALLAVASVRAVRLGIGDVRRMIVDTLRESEPALPVEPDPTQQKALRMLENPERAIERLDAWLRERVR
jgi:hypothetical protein